MSSGVSFWAQDQSAWASSAAFNKQLDTEDASVSKIFAASATSSSSAAPNVLSAVAGSSSIINGFGQAFLNSAMNGAILAAQEGNNRVNQLTAIANGDTVAPEGDLSSQVTFDGSLGANFGPAGAPMGGGYRFVSGSALQTAFQVAFGSQRSNGEAVDTVSVTGNTLTGSTSGANAHDVFNLTLDPASGMYTFQLLAPIDQSSNARDASQTVYLQGLFRAVNATGQQVSLPTAEMDIYNDYGSVTNQGNWALLHEASLTYQPPGTVSATDSTSTSTGTATSTGSTGTSSASTSSAYAAPTDPKTGYAYTANSSAALGVINSVNIFS
jgi:hypothetical protein